MLTHHPDDVPPGSVRYFTDVDRCAEEARDAAGDKVVMAHGAGVAQALLAARQLDEIEIHLVPVLLGAGRRLFPDDGVGSVDLEPIRRLEGRGVTHLRYAVRYP